MLTADPRPRLAGDLACIGEVPASQAACPKALPSLPSQRMAARGRPEDLFAAGATARGHARPVAGR